MIELKGLSKQFYTAKGAADSKLCSRTLEYLYQKDQKYDCRQHNQIFVSVIAIIDGDSSESKS